MTRLAKELKHRIQIKKATQDDNGDGGFDRDYTTLLTIWAGYKSIKYSSYVRESNVDGEGEVTGIFKIRRCAVITLGTAFTTGYSTGFNSIRNLNPLTSEYFIFMRCGSSTKGRLFRISGVQDDEERREFYRVKAIEIEERGTGFSS